MLRNAGSRHKNSGWQGQFERLKRWHGRVKSIGFREAKGEDTEDFCDYLYAFFMNCYHLRDWLQCSGGVSASALKRFVASHPEMQICRDICNGIKHFDIDRSSRDNHFAIGREYVPSNWPGSRPYLDEMYFIISGKDKYDLFLLANRCMDLWDGFLVEQGLHQAT